MLGACHPSIGIPNLRAQVATSDARSEAPVAAARGPRRRRVSRSDRLGAVDGATTTARDAAISAAGAALDAELLHAAVDARYVEIVRACSRGGCSALQSFCGVVERPSSGLDEAPVVALVAALADGDAADRGVRAVAWTMLAQRAASAWPYTFYEVLEASRAALPLTVSSFENMQALGALTACASTTEEPDTRDGQRMQFSRESLEYVIGAATGVRPARRDMLHAIAPWTSCFVRGITVCDEHLRALERERS